MTNKELSNDTPYIYLDQLSVAEVFSLLTVGACVSQGKHLDLISIIFPGSVPYKYVSLGIPDVHTMVGKPLGQEKVTVLKKLVEHFKEISGREPLVNRPFGLNDVRSLHEGVAWLLLNSANDVGERIAEEKDEFLVTAGLITIGQAETLFKNLSFHATSTRVSSVETSGTIDNQQAGRFFFHLKDDSKRKSSFMSFAAAELMDSHNCFVLRAYQSEGVVTFLPPDCQPGENQLKQFTRLIESAPLVFGSREDVTNGLLAAILQYPGGFPVDEKEEPRIQVEFLYLGGLRFYKQEEFSRRKVRCALFSFHQLTESRRNLERLGEAVESAQSGVGYRLELRSTRHLERNDLERLHAQKSRIDYNIAYLQSIHKPRPTLLRFTREQLPALAAEIRSFPMKVIREGAIKYGFQATDAQPPGYHFLLVDPLSAARVEMDPLPLWQELHAPHMHFWLDPSWSRYYYDSGGDSLVFVPEGTSLFPPIHDWERGNMDYHLREIMENWFRGQLKGKPIPTRPVYIFDGEPRPDASIHIMVLDQDAMAPLHTKLAWINDNLILHHALENEKQLSEMAKDITWGQLAQVIKERQEETQKDFSETTLAVGKYLADTTNAMTYVLTNEIDKIVKDTFRMTEKIKYIDRNLQEWEEVLSEMEEMVNQVRQQKQDVSQKITGTQNEFWRMEQQIQGELLGAEKRRKELENRVEEEIKKMQITSRQIRQRLRQLKI